MTQTIPGSTARSDTSETRPTAEFISGGHLVAKALKAEGIDTIFTLCGGHIGCAVVTAGPGTSDAVTGVANAFRAESPMLLIGGQGALSQHKFAQLLGGYGEEVRDPADIGPALQRARESGLPSLINVWVDPDVYAPGTMNQTMYK
jgi:thiamine pyrophosphate-dependent acetolactate synthase large subunit-like protein